MEDDKKENKHKKPILSDLTSFSPSIIASKNNSDASLSRFLHYTLQLND